MTFTLFLVLLALLVFALLSGTARRRSIGHSRYSEHPNPQPTYAGLLWGQPSPQGAPQGDLSVAIKATDDDITTFGDELRELDLAVVGVSLDEGARQDYQRALDAYEHAKESLAQVQVADDVKHVTSILEDGRYAISCVKARVAGEPLPAKRPPCFFNPAHGPSSQNVTWTPPGGTAREIPACPADAERVLAGAEPYIRTVALGPARVPYWEHAAYAPYAMGYYNNWQTDRVIRNLAVGTAVFAGLSMLPHILGGLGDAFENIFDEFD